MMLPMKLFYFKLSIFSLNKIILWFISTFPSVCRTLQFH